MFNIDTSYRARHYGGKNVPKYIVVHYTANDGTTATAKSNANYFAKTDREASAHYIVDEGDTVYCCVLPSNAAWAVGDSGKGRLKGIVTNFNSISVEMVSHSNKDGYYIPSKTVSNAIELIRQLMSEYKIPIIKNEFNSAVGFRGIFKKVCIFLVVAVTHMIGQALEMPSVRSLACGYYIANEGISILENTAKAGLPIPDKLKQILEQLKNDSK